jgi:hypothetical protein
MCSYLNAGSSKIRGTQLRITALWKRCQHKRHRGLTGLCMRSVHPATSTHRGDIQLANETHLFYPISLCRVKRTHHEA